ncbi:hypothetical protein DFH28DRAFT_217583 [Melampsora americana]|nr:hypothetical protein DFH28DRAFT_217583 [Melampsora americana]
MPDEIPPSSTPTTSPHEEIPPPILTPVTFQFHPSTIQSYPAFPLNTTSPNYYSTQIASNYPSGIVQQGSFGSSFNSMSSLTQSASQPVEFTKTRSKNSKPANARGGKSQSSTSYKVRATTSKPLQSPSSVKKPRKGKNVQKLDEDAPCRKPPVRWEDQKNEKGESAISILLNWITTYENWSLYKSNNNYRSKTLEIITAYLVENGIHDRSGKIVASKIGLLETQFNEAKRWIDQSGQGAMDCLEAEKEKNGWEDEDPAYVARKKLLVDSYIEARCKYYWQLEPVMGQRDKATRLASVNSAQRDNPNDSLACLGLTENESHLQGNVDLDQTQCTLPTLRNDDEHSEASNEEYHCLNTDLDNNRHIRDISNEDMSNLIDGGLSEGLEFFFPYDFLPWFDF